MSEMFCNQNNYDIHSQMNLNTNYLSQQIQINNMNLMQNNLNSFPLNMGYNNCNQNMQNNMNYTSNGMASSYNNIISRQIAINPINPNCINTINQYQNMNNNQYTMINNCMDMCMYQNPISTFIPIQNSMNNINITNNSINNDINMNITNNNVNNNHENNNSDKNIISKNENENESNQKKDKIKEQSTNEKDIQTKEISDKNTSKDNKPDNNKNESSKTNSTSNNINGNDDSTKENIKQIENVPIKQDKIDLNTDSNKSEITNSKSNEIEQNKINENEQKNKNDNNSENSLKETKNNSEIKEFKDIYADIDGEKINIIFLMPDKSKKGYKIPLNLTRKEIYYTAYSLCENQKGEFEYKTLLKLFYKGNMLINDDSIEILKNQDEIVIEQCTIYSCLNFNDLVQGKTSHIKKHFIFTDSSNHSINVDLPGDITITEMLEYINSTFNKFLDSNRFKCEIYFNKKILEKKDKEIKNVVRFNKYNDVNINIVIKNLVCLQKKPGKILKVEVQENGKFITDISFGTFEKIKDFLEDLNNELKKYKIKSFTPYFEKEGKKLDLKPDDERTFFSMDVKSNFSCTLSSLVRRLSFFGLK